MSLGAASPKRLLSGLVYTDMTLAFMRYIQLQRNTKCRKFLHTSCKPRDTNMLIRVGLLSCDKFTPISNSKTENYCESAKKISMLSIVGDK